MTPKNFTPRDVLKIGAIAPAAARALASQSASPPLSEAESPRQETSNSPDASPRERLLLDFNWRFHFGRADDYRANAHGARNLSSLPSVHPYR